MLMKLIAQKEKSLFPGCCSPVKWLPPLNRQRRFCNGTVIVGVWEEYHTLLKSGCQAERYRLAAEGYLEHRRKTPIGIQVLWRGWAKLHDLVEGWQLANQT